MKKLLVLLLLSMGLVAGDLSKDKQFGVAINPIWWTSVGFSYFNHDKGYEIAVPVFGMVDEVHADVRYRHYVDGKIGGLFVGGFGRYTYMDGKLKDEYANAKISKVGLGAEVGYRVFNIFGNERLFWGVSAGAGAYLSKNNNRYADAYLGDAPFIIDLELFKFGVVF